MDGFGAYKLWISLHLHFTTDYDYFLNDGRVKANLQSFQLRRDKYTFHKLVRKYSDLEGFYIANLVYDDVTWTGNLMTGKADQNYKRWLKINNAITKIFTDDVQYIFEQIKDDPFKVVSGHNPKLLVMVYQQLVSIESLLILNEIVPFLDTWNKQLVDVVMWPTFYEKCVKYRPWIQKSDLQKFL